jgi:hypothetical protein
MAIEPGQSRGVESNFRSTLEIPPMKNLLAAFARSRVSLALLLAGSCDGLTAVLQAKETTSPGRKTERVTPGELQAMDAFLDSHAVIDDQLRQHPGLAGDARFLKHHPEYAEFLAGHPGVAAELKEHPRYFVHRALLAQRRQPVTPAELKKLDAFLDQHPGLEKALAANPKLADDPKFVAAHPEFRKFLNTHPKVGGALAAKPRQTVRREQRLDKREAKAGKS